MVLFNSHVYLMNSNFILASKVQLLGNSRCIEISKSVCICYKCFNFDFIGGTDALQNYED